MSQARNAWQIFRWPLLIALASLIGLLAALVGDGGWDAVSWVLLGVPLCVGVYLSQRRSKRG